MLVQNNLVYAFVKLFVMENILTLCYSSSKVKVDLLVFVFLLSICCLRPCFCFSLLKLYNYFEDSNYVYLVLEMCHNGEMSRYLKDRKKPFTEDEGDLKNIYIFFVSTVSG